MSPISKWLFPDAEGGALDREAIGTLLGWREYIGGRTTPKTTTLEKEDEPDAPLLEQHDAEVQDEYLNEAIRHIPLNTILEIKRKQIRANSPLYAGTITRRAFAWTVLFAYLIFIYGALYYFAYFVADNSTHIVDIVSSSITNAYTDLADAYNHATYPAKQQEVADLMTELYELLADMGYYDRSLIAQPPHTNPGINKTLAAELQFSQAAIEMMKMLPYLNIDHSRTVFNWDAGSYGNEFILYGIFADMRKDSDLTNSRDPYYIGPEEESYIDPNHVALSGGGEEGALLMVDAQSMQMWTFQMSGNMDPDTQNTPDISIDSAFSPLQYPSRPARDVLRSYITRVKSLEWMPGGQYNGSWGGDEVARLYRKNGWGHESFNVSNFLFDRTQWLLTEEKREEAEKPFEKVRDLDRSLGYLLDNIKRSQKEIAAIDAGKGDKERYPDMPKRRAELVQQALEASTRVPVKQAELETAREKLGDVDPAIRKAREDRIAKYGW